MHVLNGGPAKPTDKPPRPFEEGVDGLPTLVSNVETLANLPYIQQHGAAEFRAHGTSQSPGTLLVTITGAGRPPGLYEIPHGVAFTELLALHGVSTDQVQGVLMGGYFAGLLNRDVLGLTLDHESNLRSSAAGSDAARSRCSPTTVRSRSPRRCWRTSTARTPDSAARASTAPRRCRRSPGHCATGSRRDEDLARLRRWSVVLRGRGACATLDAATNVAASLLDQFDHTVQRHLENDCKACKAGAFRADRPYEVEG